MNIVDLLCPACAQPMVRMGAEIREWAQPDMRVIPQFGCGGCRRVWTLSERADVKVDPQDIERVVPA